VCWEVKKDEEIDPGRKQKKKGFSTYDGTSTSQKILTTVISQLLDKQSCTLDEEKLLSFFETGRKAMKKSLEKN